LGYKKEMKQDQVEWVSKNIDPVFGAPSLVRMQQPNARLILTQFDVFTFWPGDKYTTQQKDESSRQYTKPATDNLSFV
jgi:hypothetical protein